MQFSFYWPTWYKLYPWWIITPADEDDPRTLWGGFGPIQFRKYLWYDKR